MVKRPHPPDGTFPTTERASYMLLRKAQGGCAVGPYEWPEDGDTCEVPDDLAAELLAIVDNDYTIATGNGKKRDIKPPPEAKASPPAMPQPPPAPPPETVQVKGPPSSGPLQGTAAGANVPKTDGK